MTIGIITAAGRAERIHGLPKYLLPVPGGYLLETMCRRMKPVTTEIMVAANDDNYSIVSSYAPGDARVGSADIGTMNQAILDIITYETTQRPAVVCGMSDSYWTDEYVYEKLEYDLAEGGSVVSLALFKMREGQHNYVGNCGIIHETKVIVKIVDKPKLPTFPYCWGALAWKPAFWKYIVASDSHVGYAAQRAIEAGESVRGVLMDGDYWDCGTPERYFEMIRTITK